MNDLQLLRDVAKDVPLLEPHELTAARDRLSAAMVEERAELRPSVRFGRLARLPRERRVRRLVLAGSLTTVIAAAFAIVLVLLPEQVGGRTAVADARAAQVLYSAAEVVSGQPFTVPRPDQFVYQKVVANGAVSEMWLSVDGTHDGLAQNAGEAETISLPGCRDGQRAAIKGDRVIGSEPCTPQPMYLPDLPTDARGMLAYLNSFGVAGDANAMGKTVLDLIGWHYLRPQSRAALFQAAANIPGLRVVADAVDGAGRHGIGIVWSSEGKSGELIFDPKTYAFLGFGGAGGGTTALVRIAIVNGAGQRP